MTRTHQGNLCLVTLVLHSRHQLWRLKICFVWCDKKLSLQKDNIFFFGSLHRRVWQYLFSINYQASSAAFLLCTYRFHPSVNHSIEESPRGMVIMVGRKLLQVIESGVWNFNYWVELYVKDSLWNLWPLF